LGRHLQLHDAVPKSHDGTVDSAAGYHSVAGFEAGQHLLHFAPLALLRPDDEKIPDQKEGRKQEEELGKPAPRAGIRSQHQGRR